MNHDLDTAATALSDIEMMASSAIWMCKNDDPEVESDICYSYIVLESVDEEVAGALALGLPDSPAESALQRIHELRTKGFSECDYAHCHAVAYVDEIVSICRQAKVDGCA